MSSKLRFLLPVALPIILTLSVSYFLQAKILANQEVFTNWLSSFGSLIILVYVVLQAITIIIAPIGGFFLVVAMLALFGPEKALLLAYLVATPCYMFNFYLAKKYGRPFVRKVIGQEPLEKLDHIVEDAGVPLLVITRALQGGNFDYLSYVWGLTKVPFKTFAVINLFAGIPGSLIIYFLFTRFDNLLFGIVAFYASSIVFSGLAIYLAHRIKKHKKN